MSKRFSVTPHIDYLLAACAQTLFALRTLRHHGLHNNSIQAIFQATVVVDCAIQISQLIIIITVVAKLAYASPAWVGFANAADLARLEAFLKRSVSFGYRSASSPNFASISDEVNNNATHLLHPLLPPLRDSHYNLRDRSHPYQLPIRTTVLRDCNFIIRMLYRNADDSIAH